MNPVSDAIAAHEARRNARLRLILRLLMIGMAGIAVWLLWAIRSEYTGLTTTLPATVLQAADSVAWEAGYAHWLDTVDGGAYSQR